VRSTTDGKRIAFLARAVELLLPDPSDVGDAVPLLLLLLLLLLFLLGLPGGFVVQRRVVGEVGWVRAVGLHLVDLAGAVPVGIERYPLVIGRVGGFGADGS